MKNFLSNLKNIIGNKKEGTPEKNEGKKIELREGTAELEMFMATYELESKKNLAHGASHLANLLSYNPANQEWLEMADQYIAAAGNNPEQKLLPPEEKRYASTEALRAYIWHREGKLTEATDLLININQANPHLSYLESWGADWLSLPGTIESMPESTVTHVFAIILNQFGEAHVADYNQLQLVRRWAGFLSRIPYESPQWTMIRIGLLRKSGYLDEALALARSKNTAENWHQAIAIGLILRRQNKPEEAEKAFQKALEFTPDDISARLEAADTWFGLNYWEQALAWYNDILSIEPEHTWAVPSSLYCCWKLTQKDDLIDKVIQLAKAGNSRAYDLWFKAFGALPEPHDATANVMRQIIADYTDKSAEKRTTGDIKLTVSSLEAPSNALAFRLEMGRLNWDISLKVEVSDIPNPDPRNPVQAIEWPLWKYNGTDGTPALPVPSEEIKKDMEALAQAPYDPIVNWAAASHIAIKWGAQHCAGILAVAVHPPAIPKDSHALAWLPRVQLCVAQVVAQIDSGWDDSLRKKALLSMLFGPSDWIVNAAIRAMVQLAEKEKTYQLPIHECFLVLEKHIPPDSYCCWAEALYDQWARLSLLYDKERDELRSKLEKLTN